MAIFACNRKPEGLGIEVKIDGLAWMHVSDLAYWNNSAAKLYAVTSIPSILIVDNNGIIKAKDKRGKELEKTIAELLN